MNSGVQKRIRDLFEFVNVGIDNIEDAMFPDKVQVLFVDEKNDMLIFEYAGEYAVVDWNSKKLEFWDKDRVEYYLGNEIVSGITLKNFARAVLRFPALFKLRKKAVIVDGD